METSKTKNGKSKTIYIYIYIYIYKEREREMKTFFTIVALKQPNSPESNLTVYRYSL